MIYEYIALDVETTGMNPVNDKVLEIGAARVRGGKVCETYSTLINTGVPIPLRIQQLTGITDAMQKTGKQTGTAIREFVTFCGNLPIVGHNIPFDFGFLKQTAANAHLSFEKEALDTLKIARKTLPLLPSRTLQALCVYYHIDPGNAHRALDDALAAHELLQKLWEEFGMSEPQIFIPHKLVYTIKKSSPITKSQKGYLNDLLKYHKIETNIHIEDMTKSEASRMIDQIILQYGRIMH